MQLENKNVVIVGGSRGVGRVIAKTANDNGARVLVAARRSDSLEEIAAEIPGIETLKIDAAQEGSPEIVFETLRPDLLVLCGGAIPHMAPVHEHTWDDFSRNWNSDVKSSFLFCRAALSAPLAPGATVILLSSGAAIGGSTMSGGYAGAKRMQMFMADYCQIESDRAHLGLRFIALAPGRIMPTTDLGKAAVAGYASRLGVSEADFVQGMDYSITPQNVADALIEIAAEPAIMTGNVFIVTGKGVEPYPAP